MSQDGLNGLERNVLTWKKWAVERGRRVRTGKEQALRGVGKCSTGHHAPTRRQDALILPEQLLFAIAPFRVDWNEDTLLYIRGSLGNPFECRALFLKTGQTRRVQENVDDCRLSPDGRWVAYATHENPHTNALAGPLQILVTDFAAGHAKHQVSESSGIAPQWSHDGKQLYYLEQSTLSLVRTEARFSNGVPHFRVVDKSNPNMLAELVYAVSPDNKRILIQRTPEPTVVIMTNFTQSLNSRE